MKMLKSPAKEKQKEEKGAALVMALLMTFLLMIAAFGLLLESSLNAFNVTDATAEQEAYNAAESGIQSVVNVLRYNCTAVVSPCKVAPSPLLNTSKPDYDKTNKLTYSRALDITSSNLSTTGNDATPRLSRWIGYQTGTYSDRVKLGDPSGTYTTQNGYAYKVSVSDPDNTSALISYTTTGHFNSADPGNSRQITYTSGSNYTRITYTPTSKTNLDASSGMAITDFGTFTVTCAPSPNTCATIPGYNRFEIVTNITVPYWASQGIFGYIEPTTTNTPPRIIFDSQTYTVSGSVIDITSIGSGTSMTFVNQPNASPPVLGYDAPLASGDNLINATMGRPEPIRLLIRSTGYGPRGAVKQLEAIIQKNFLNNLTAPATLTLVGPANTTSPSTSFLFNPGSSNVTTYSGDDAVSTDIIPPIGTTDSGGSNLDAVQSSVDGLPPHPFNGNIVGMPTNVNQELPPWLSTPSQMDAAVHQLADVAKGSAPGRFFASGTQPTSFGDNTAGTGITFCDGNCEFSGDGGGILVVTGKLTLKGNFNFNGLIIVTGQAGVDRSGGGTGIIQGNIVVAPYVSSQIADTQAVGSTFLAPQYDLSGGGNSTIQYNSNSVANGLTAISNFVLGVVEK
jgi:hypothetical protein